MSRYETTWTTLHKLRRAMVRPGRDRLCGELEVDKSYVGGAAPGKGGVGALGKAIAAIAVEALGIAVEALGVGERSQRIASGRVRLAGIRDCSELSLIAFCEDTITAVIETVDGSLVERLVFDRFTGEFARADE